MQCDNDMTAMPDGSALEEDSSQKIPGAMNTAAVLSVDVWALIFEFVPASDLLENAAKVSRSFASIIHNDRFWKAYTEMVIMKNQDDEICNYYKEIHGLHEKSRLLLQHLCVVATTEKDNAGHHLCTHPQALLPNTAEARLLPSGSICCLASSTHHTPREGIDCTLSPASKWAFNGRPMMPGWWSSVPTASPDTNETLFYTTKGYQWTYLTALRINPLVDLFRGSIQVYGWHQLQINAYLLPTDHLESHAISPTSRRRVAPDKDRIQALIQDQTPVYQSPLLPARTLPARPTLDTNAWEVHEFPPGIVANIVVVTLHGKTAREMMGYYACVEQVKLEGSRLYEDREGLLKNLRRLGEWKRRSERGRGARYCAVDYDEDDEEDDDDENGSSMEGDFSSVEEEEDDAADQHVGIAIEMAEPFWEMHRPVEYINDDPNFEGGEDNNGDMEGDDEEGGN